MKHLCLSNFFRPGRLRRAGAGLCGLLWLAPGIVQALESADEYRLKAAFLYNIARMVEWPAPGSAKPAASFRICFYGAEQFGETLETIADKTVNNRPLEFKRNMQQQVTAENTAGMRETLGECEMLFVSRQVPADRWPGIFEAARGLPLLTVGETEPFALKGGMISLLRDTDKIKIQINLHATESASLSISSRLLSLAELVENLKGVLDETAVRAAVEAPSAPLAYLNLAHAAPARNGGGAPLIE